MPRIRNLAAAAAAGVWASSAWAQERMVDTDGAIDLAGAVVVPSKVAVLLLFLAMVLLSVVGALLTQRSQERREAEEARRKLEARVAAQEEELQRLRAELGQQEKRGGLGKSSRPSV